MDYFSIYEELKQLHAPLFLVYKNFYVLNVSDIYTRYIDISELITDMIKWH